MKKNISGNDSKLALLLSLLNGVKKTDYGFSAFCPAINNNPHLLQITTNESGGIIVWCIYDCGIESILTAAGLSIDDIFPDDLTPNYRNLPDRQKEFGR
jgi:hypothetical protein